MISKIGFAGSFDPMTEGHLWMVKQAANIAGKVLVMVAGNPAKQSMFTVQERVDMIKQVMLSEQLADRVDVVRVHNDYVAHFAQDAGCDYLIRGIRSSGEFDYENLIQQTNQQLLGGIPSLFLMPPRDLASVSSSFVKGLIGSSTWWFRVKQLVPRDVYNEVLKRYLWDRWSYACKPMNLLNEREAFNNLIREYTEPHRHYHNVEHLVNCFTELEHLGNYTCFSCEPLVALFYHDVVFDPRVESNLSDEEYSASTFQHVSHGVTSFNQRVAALICGTAHLTSNRIQADTEYTDEEQGLASMQSVVNDVDFAVLGSRPEIYNWYSEGVSREYEFVDRDEYLLGRYKVLTKLIDLATKGELFQNTEFKHLHPRAIKNMRGEQAMLAFEYNNRCMRADGDYLKVPKSED